MRTEMEQRGFHLCFCFNFDVNVKCLPIYFILNQLSVIYLLLEKQISKLLSIYALFLSQNIWLCFGAWEFSPCFSFFLSFFYNPQDSHPNATVSLTLWQPGLLAFYHGSRSCHQPIVLPRREVSRSYNSWAVAFEEIPGSHRPAFQNRQEI